MLADLWRVKVNQTFSEHLENSDTEKLKHKSQTIFEMIYTTSAITFFPLKPVCSINSPSCGSVLYMSTVEVYKSDGSLH